MQLFGGEWFLMAAFNAATAIRASIDADRIDVDVARPGIQDGGQVDEPAWSLSVVTTLRRRRFGCRLRSRIKRQSFLLFTTTPWWRGAALTRRYP